MNKREKSVRITGSSNLRSRETLPPSGSHGVALNPIPSSRKRKRPSTDNSVSVHLTVRVQNKSLTRRHLRLLLEVLLYEIILRGIDLTQYLMLVYLYQTILGQKLNPMDLNDEHERRLCLLSEIIMKDLSDKEFVADMPIKELLTPELRKNILESELIMSERTYNSRRSHWAPETWIRIRPVVVETLYERSGNSARYSSYCKGYGESHPSAHFKRTSPSAELDGEEPVTKDFSLRELVQLLVLNQLNLKPKKRSKKS